MDKYGKYAVAALFVIFAATLAPWRFDFPLNDDWAYALAVKNLAETGRLTLCDWGSSTQVFHILFGALCSKLFGFSFSALRAANVLVAAGAVFVFVKLLDEFEAGFFEKAAAGLTLAFSPLYLVLANSFMTDVHYFFWMTCALYFYVRRLKDPGDAPALVWAGVCVAAAYLTRQLAVALPRALPLSLLAQGRARWRTLAAVWGPPAAAMAGYALWFRLMHGQTWASENYVAAATLAHVSSPLSFLNDSFYRLFASMAEAGLLLLPLAAGYVFSLGRFTSRNGTGSRVSAAGPWLALAAMAGFALLNGPLPYLENTLANSGLGALTLAGSAFKPSGVFSSRLFWLAATAAAVVSSVVLMNASGLALRRGGPALRFVALAAFGQLAISLMGAKYFDRYLLPTLLPWFAMAAVFAARGIRFSRPAAGFALALYALLGWAGTKDYLAWNKAKWELACKPREEIKPEDIINGFDFEAWHNYERNMAYLKAMKPLKLIGEWDWQKVHRYRARISFAPDPRMQVLDTAEYATPLSPRKGVLYLMIPKPQNLR
ncbi:MAG: hypothetical protein NDI60_06015 [Elusimicrobiales bacterium]|nr:hypothetical protein [Elusimicrobiales bacterium]